jgi:phospholipid/cholesterol/gamma-HCH transport system substrate-binding protein
MSDTNKATLSTRVRVGTFAAAGLALILILTVYVNNRPFWWRPCEPVQVTVEDATGLKRKTPVKSLGLEIGYISEIGLVSDGVKVRICVTAPVEMEPNTKAYVRGEGFLGDRFLELKPVKYTGKHDLEDNSDVKHEPPIQSGPAEASPIKSPAGNSSVSTAHVAVMAVLNHVMSSLIPTASAQETGAPVADGSEADTRRANSKLHGRDIPVAEKTADMQQIMTQMNGLMKDLKSAINPDEIRGTIRQLNKTLEDASKALSPQGGLTATAQRSLIKLEDAIEQLRDQMTRINQGQGSVGMILNDPAYAEELKKALVNLNHLLNRASDLRLNVILGINQLSAYHGTRSSVEVMIYPRPDRFYLLGISSDPRGTISQNITTTQTGQSTTSFTTTNTNKGGFAFSVLIGKVFTPRVALGVGLLHGDGAAQLGFNLGWGDNLEQLQLFNELYFRSKTVDGQWTAEADDRIYLIYQPYSILFLTAGMEGLRRVDNNLSTFYGAGIRFEDEDIRLLFSFL